MISIKYETIQKTFINKEGQTVNYDEVRLAILEDGVRVTVPIKAVYGTDSKLFRLYIQKYIEQEKKGD